MPDLNSALEVSVGVTGGSTTVTGRPVSLVDLENTNIESTIVVVVSSVTVTSGFVAHDASAAGLVPASELGAPGVDVNGSGRGTARAAGAVAGGAVTTAGVGESLDSEKEDSKGDESGSHGKLINNYTLRKRARLKKRQKNVN